MSTRTPKVSPVVPEEWRPKRRVEGGLRQVRRNKERELIFKGQDKGEQVKMVVRKHPLVLLRPALPPLGVLGLLILVSIIPAFISSLGFALGVLDLLLVIVFLVTLGYFLWKHFLLWWVEIDIITTKRIVSCRGFLQAKRQSIPLENIVQVSLSQDTILGTFLGFGNVHIYLQGRQHVLSRVPHPRKIRDALQGIYENIKATIKPAPDKPHIVADAELQELIDKLGKKEVTPTLPDADERYAHLRNPEKLRGPLRRFGGPLRIPAEVTYASDEYTVMYIQRSKWILLFRLIAPAAVVLVCLILTFIFTLFAFLTLTVIFVVLIIMALLTVNYVDDVFILTNKRVIDIERKFIFFFEAHDEAEFKNIRDTRVRITNIFENMLDIGTVMVETPGNNPDIIMSLVEHPFFIQDKINQLKGFKEKVDKANDKNTRQAELSKWFTQVTAALEKKIANRGVPDLQRMDLWTAAAMAAELGMKVVPVGEDDSYPNIEAGAIVSQKPLPGTLMSVGSDDENPRPQIHVVLSKRA